MPAPLIAHQEVVAGDDYKAADGRPLAWGPSQSWPDLAGARLAMAVGHDQYNLYGDLPLTWVGAVPATPNAPATVSLDVTNAQTGALTPGEYDYTLQATLVDGDQVTIAMGKLTVLATPGTWPWSLPAI